MDTSQNMLGFFPSIYLNSIYSNAVKMANLTYKDSCLDFGCGNQGLKPFIKKGDYIGYDIIPEFSDIKHYAKIKPTVFFALNVLEHLTDEEIESLCRWLVSVKPRKTIVSFPTNYFLTKVLVFLFALDLKHEVEHVNYWKNIVKVLRKHFYLAGYKRVFFLQWITEWKAKKEVK